MSAVGTRNEATRHEWLVRTLAALPAGARILDAGAGEQPYRRHCAHLDYVAQDLGRYRGKGDGRGLHTGAWDTRGIDLICDIGALPVADGSFAAVLCSEVLEHLPEPLAALRELARVLAPGGQLILTAPFCSLTHFAPEFFATGFSRYFYATHLAGLGLEIVELVGNGNFHEFVAQELRRSAWVAAQHGRARPRLYERLALRVVLGMLGRFSRRDTGSQELLHFGHFVRARKR